MSGTYLCYLKATRPTGRVMAKELGVPSFGIRRPQVSDLDVLIRWGSCAEMPYASVEINTPKAIATASNKVAAFDAMKADGIPIVPVYKTWHEARTVALDAGHEIFGRSARGYGGKDIVVYDWEFIKSGRGPVKHHDFYTIFYDAPREARLHVVGERVVRVQVKYGDHADKTKKQYIKNYAHGYRFRAPREELHMSRRNAAIQAVKACGLDFGAVDLLVFGDRQHYVLEVNTAPACSPLTARCYAGEIANLVDARTHGRVRLAPNVREVEMHYDEMED